MTCQISSGSDNVGTSKRFQNLRNLIIMSLTDWLMLLPSESQSKTERKISEGSLRIWHLPTFVTTYKIDRNNFKIGRGFTASDNKQFDGSLRSLSSLQLPSRD